MGCHTWCYAELPKSAKFEKKIMECFSRGFNEMYKVNYETSDSEWNVRLEEEIEAYRSWYEYYKTVENPNDYKALGFESEDEMLKYNEKCKNADSLTIEDIKNEYHMVFEPAYEDFKNMTNIYDFIKKYGDGYAWGFYGGLELVNDKIYTDTNAYFQIPNFDSEKEYIFPESERFSDMFRIGDYNAPNCYTVDETKNIIKKWVTDNPYVDYRGSKTVLHDILNGTNNCIEKFFEIHPTGMISFG